MSVRRSLAPWARRVALASGVCHLMRQLRPSRELGILRYHAIAAPSVAWYATPGICVSPEAFERHVAYISARYQVLPLPDATALLADHRPLPPNAVAFTFDDGYADNLVAARILAKYGVSGTFYLTAGCLADGDPFWPSEIRAHVRQLTGQTVRLEVGGAPVAIPLSHPSQCEAAARTLARLFKSNPIPVREDLRRQLRRLSGLETVPSPMLSWDDVRAMRRLGMTIGSHTVSHANLPSAGTAARLEIEASKARLEAELGEPVTMFSYPNGGAERYCTPDLARMVAEAGYSAATTSANGFATHQSDIFALERVKVAEQLADVVFALEVERFVLKPPRQSLTGGAVTSTTTEPRR